MLSVGAVVLVAVATPVVATPLFLAGIRWGANLPRIVLAALALVLALPGVVGVLALGGDWSLDAVTGILLTVTGGITLLDPRYLERIDRYWHHFPLPSRDDRRTTPNDEPATYHILLRAGAGLAVLTGLYLTATVAIEPTTPATITPATLTLVPIR